MLTEMLRSAVRWYVRNAPVNRGKGRLVHAAWRLDGGADGAHVRSELAPGIPLELDLRSHVERDIFYWGFYRPFVLPYFDALLAPGRAVVDVGANVGEFALWAGARVGAAGHVIAFEPNPTVFAKLARNIALCGFAHVRAAPDAVGDFDGAALLHENAEGDTNEGQASLTPLEMHATTHVVRCRTLDAALASYGLPTLDVLKIDTQGTELEVLRGARGTLERSRPAVLLRCYEEKSRANGTSTRDIQVFLMDLGYELYQLDPARGRVRVAEPRVYDDLTLLATPGRR